MKIKNILIGLAFAVSISSCVEKVPITGRKQVSTVDESELVGLSLTEYQEFLSQHSPLPASHPKAEMVRNVGVKIQNAVTKFMADKGLSERLKGYKWEFNCRLP